MLGVQDVPFSNSWSLEKERERGGEAGNQWHTTNVFREIPPTLSVRIHVKGSQQRHAQIEQEGDRFACLQPSRGNAKVLAVVPFWGKGPVAGYSADNETRVQ